MSYPLHPYNPAVIDCLNTSALTVIPIADGLTLGHRDTPGDVVRDVVDQLQQVFDHLPRADGQAILQHLHTAGHQLAPHIRLHPSEFASGYVYDGRLVVLDSLAIADMHDEDMRRLILHELAHVWQGATGELSIMATRRALCEDAADALARRWFWRVIPYFDEVTP